MASQFPREVLAILHTGDGAWLVGSAADPLNKRPRDYDILVPYHLWHSVAAQIPLSAVPNSFRGWKFKTTTGAEVDVWPGDMAWLMQRPMFRHGYHPLSGTRILKQQ